MRAMTVDGNVPAGSASPVRSVLWGTAGGAALLSVYFLVLTWSNSLDHALEELGVIGGWIGLMVAGFAVQTGLFAHIRHSLKARPGGKTAASMAASGGMSTSAMVACCMHHVTDLVPVLGASAAALFLAQYRTVFLAAGVASNLIGTVLMLRVIGKNALFDPDRGFLRRLAVIDMDRALALSVLLGLTIVASALYRHLR